MPAQSSPGKFGSGSAWFLVGGYNLISSKLKSLSYKIASVMEDTTGLGDTWGEHTPVGLMNMTLTQDGALFDTTTVTGAHVALSASLPTTPQAVPRIAMLGFGGNTYGERFIGMAGDYTEAYDVQAQLGNLTKANATHRVSGQMEHGSIVQGLITITADLNTKSGNLQIDYTLDTSQRSIPITANTLANPSVVSTPVPHGLATGDIILIAGVITSNPTINGERTVTVISTTSFSVPVNVTTAGTGGTFVRANSPNGGVGYLQVTDASGFTNHVSKIRDSPDDVTYADLIVFTDNVSDPYAERLTVAGVVDRYLSFEANVTGTGSITLASGFSRNAPA